MGINGIGILLRNKQGPKNRNMQNSCSRTTCRYFALKGKPTAVNYAGSFSHTEKRCLCPSGAVCRECTSPWRFAKMCYTLQ